MKCDRCKKNEACCNSITNINGKVTEKHLCGECASKDNEFEINSRSYLDDFMSDFKTSFSYFTNPFSSTMLDFDDFFDNEFGNNFLKFNSSKENNNESEKTLKSSKKKDEISENEKKALELKKLDIQLKKAVVEERYEDAIILRDKIKELKNK